MTKLKKRVLLFFILAVVILGIITELVPELTGALTQTEILQYGNMQITDDVMCYFVRNETVYMAPSTGTINYYVEDGVKVRKNAKILDIIPQAADAEVSVYSDIITRLGSSGVTLSQMNSAKNGIVSYYVDGYEGVFTPENIQNLTYKQISEFKTDPLNLTRTATISGEPLFKICEGNYWYLAAWVEPGNIAKYEVDKKVKISLPLGQIDARIESLSDQDDKWLVIMKTTRYYEDFARIRCTAGTVITQDYSGILIRNSSITTEDGKAGVYIKARNGEFVFRPIKIITSDGENSLVNVSSFIDEEGNSVDTVEIYDEILKNPAQDSQESK